MTKLVRQFILSILLLELIFVCIMTRNRKRLHTLRFEECHKHDNLNYFIRLHFECFVLSVAKSTRRKYSERKLANRSQKMKYGNRKNRELRIVSWNSGHTYLINQMNEVKMLVQEKSPHILFVSESNLRRSHDKEKVELDGYGLQTTRMIRCLDRQASRLVAYVKDGIIAKRREDLETDDFSSIWMEVGLPREKKYLVCGVYREWAHLKVDGQISDESGSIQEQERRWDSFLDFWEDALDEADDVTVIGDCNIDLGKVFQRGRNPCRMMADSLRLRIYSRGVVQLIKENTRFVSSCEPSLLDHIYMTRPELGSYSVSEWGTSDHRLLELRKKVKGCLPENSRMRKRTFKHFSRKNFIEDVKQIKWYESVYSKEEVDEAAEGWNKEFTKVLDRHCPVKSIIIRKNYTPWMTPDIIVASKFLQREQRKVKNNWTREAQELVQTKTKLLKEKIKNAEEVWRSKEAKKVEETGAKTWENIKKWVGWKSSNQPAVLKDPLRNNSVSVGAHNLCRIMNDYYIDKVKVNKDEMPLVEGNPCSELQEMVSADDGDCFNVVPVTPDLVLKTGKRMRKTTSMGADDIPADLFQLALPYMLPAVTHVFNLSLTQAKFPSIWKKSKICPLFKGGSQESREEPK